MKKKSCLACGRGLYEECKRGGKCLKREPIYLTTDEDVVKVRKHGSVAKDLKDPKSTGRKRAAQLYPLDPVAPCEWQLKKNCGGGMFPIIGCMDGLQKHRHHGPVKDTTRNHSGNVHRICTSCVGLGSRILTADLRWIAAEDIKVGDRLLTFDEELGKGTGAPLFKFTTVTNTAIVREPSYLMIMANGDELVSSHAHKWVASSPSRDHLKWFETGDLFNRKRGGQWLREGYNLRHLFNPWNEDSSWKAGWLAGYLDGEGCINRTHLSVAQKNGNVSDFGAKLLAEYSQSSLNYTKRESVQYDYIEIYRVTDLPGILRILGSVRPLRLLDKLPELLQNKSTACNRKMPIDHHEYIGEQDVVSITTESSTLIVEGYLSHNCHNHWHELNDLSYEPKGYALLPHDPEPATVEECAMNQFEWMNGTMGKKYTLASTKNHSKHKQLDLTD